MGGAAQKTVQAGSDRAEGLAGEQMPRGVLLEWHLMPGVFTEDGRAEEKSSTWSPESQRHKEQPGCRVG